MISDVNGLVMEYHQLVCSQGEHGIRTTMVVAEFNLVGIRFEKLDNRADLPPAELAVRQVFGQRYHIKQMDFVRCHGAHSI